MQDTETPASSTWALLLAALFPGGRPDLAAGALAALLLLIMLSTAVGNLFVMVAILIERNLRTVGNYLVLSLAIADLLVACLVMPLASISQLLDGWTLGVLLCDIWTSTDVFCCTASILHLLAIALDRYWAVTRVDYIRCQRNERRILQMIGSIWLAATCISLAPIFGWKDAEFELRITRERECLISQDIGYQIFATCATFYFPLILILIFYWKIYQVARKRIRRKPGNRLKAARQHPSTSSSTSTAQQQQPADATWGPRGAGESRALISRPRDRRPECTCVCHAANQAGRADPAAPGGHMKTTTATTTTATIGAPERQSSAPAAELGRANSGLALPVQLEAQVRRPLDGDGAKFNNGDGGARGGRARRAASPDCAKCPRAAKRRPSDSNCALASSLSGSTAAELTGELNGGLTGAPAHRDDLSLGSCSPSSSLATECARHADCCGCCCQREEPPATREPEVGAGGEAAAAAAATAACVETAVLAAADGSARVVAVGPPAGGARTSLARRLAAWWPRRRRANAGANGLVRVVVDREGRSAAIGERCELCRCHQLPGDSAGELASSCALLVAEHTRDSELVSLAEEAPRSTDAGGCIIAASTANIALNTTVRAAAGPAQPPAPNPLEGVESRRERKAAKTLAIITGVFVMCWLPFFLMALAMPLLSLKPNKYVFAVLLWLGYVNSMLNPIIYTIFSPDFRKAFKRLLCGSDAARR